MKSRIARSRLLYLRRIETGSNEVLKRILEDSKKNKKSKWWETTRKYMNWAQIEEREIKESTAKEIRGKIAKVVEEEWRKLLSRVNGVVESENKPLKSRRELLVEKQRDMCGMQ